MEGLGNAVTDILGILADGIADEARRIHRVNGEGEFGGGTFANDIGIINGMANHHSGGSVNQRHLVSGTDVLYRLVGDGVGVMPCVIAFRRNGNHEGCRTAVGHRGKRRHRRHRAYHGCHLCTLTLTTRLRVVALHKIRGGGVGHIGGIFQRGSLHHRAITGEEPLAGVGILAYCGSKGHRTGTAAHLVGHRRLSRILIHRGRHRHTLALTTGIGVIIRDIVGSGSKNRSG